MNKSICLVMIAALTGCASQKDETPGNFIKASDKVIYDRDSQECHTQADPRNDAEQYLGSTYSFGDSRYMPNIFGMFVEGPNANHRTVKSSNDLYSECMWKKGYSI